MSYDPTARSASAAQPAPGWYPDPSGGSLQRWWDGNGWTAQTYSPGAGVPSTGPRKVEPGTPVYTPWIWAIVLMPLLSVISLFFFDFTAYFRESFAASVAISADPSAPVDPFAGSQGLISPGYLAINALSFAIYLASGLFAFLDRRALLRRGFDRPFHWAWTFLSSLAYIIGRSVIVKRRAGSGLAPIWVMIAVTVVSIIITFAVIGGALASVIPDLGVPIPQVT